MDWKFLSILSQATYENPNPIVRIFGDEALGRQLGDERQYQDGMSACIGKDTRELTSLPLPWKKAAIL